MKKKFKKLFKSENKKLFFQRNFIENILEIGDIVLFS